MTKSRSILSLGCHEKGENRTEWDFEFWCKLNELSDLRYTARSRIVSDAVEMEDKYWMKCLDENLLTCVAQTGRVNLHGLRRLRL
jgi:hypothetical protein